MRNYLIFFRVCLNINSPEVIHLGIETLFNMSEYKVLDVIKAAICFMDTLPLEL